MNEKEYSRKFVELFSPHFNLFPSVYMRHPIAGSDLIIDFVGFSRNESVLGPIGFEIKDPLRWDSSTGHFRGFTSALAQCMDYQNRLINSQFKDTEYTQFFNTRLRYTFLFPVDPKWAYQFELDESISSNMAQGALKLAGKFGVGAVCEAKYDWLMTLGGCHAFSLKNGPNDLFYKHAVATRTGSSK
tara:strand:- start:2 stop:562 length:561 start_codon:yes stop_codon:yes gene_type:complete